jgi:glycosyltransferase involved in cell wall biosynthesis
MARRSVWPENRRDVTSSIARAPRAASDARDAGSRLRVLALVQKRHGLAPNQRFRLEQWAPHLARDHAIDVEFAAFESPALSAVLYEPGHVVRKARLTLRDAWRRRAERARAREFDAVVVLREASLLGGAWLERAIAREGVPIVYDFDDAIWVWDPRSVNGVLTAARFPWKVAEICRLASAVTVGNEFLAEYARPHNAHVALVRTSIDTDRFTRMPTPAEDGPFTLAWTGSHSTLPHLETLRGALATLAERVPTRLRVVCDVAPPPIPGVALDFRRWTPESEASDLAPAHVGLMPLPDTPAARGKCGCKALQYMALGRPAVVSPVGINREIVRHGVNGFHASTDDEWVARLTELARTPALRARLGDAAHATVHAGFTARSSAAAFADVVRGAVARAGCTRALRVG